MTKINVLNTNGEKIKDITLNKEVFGIVPNDAVLYDAIKLERKEALAKAQYAELTTGNLLFKSLRRNGYMEKLINLRRKCFDIIHSVR